MAHDDPNSRPASKNPCIYWSGTECTAVDFFPEGDITCYHEGNCDGFGTCRSCSKYDRGGLKFGTSDGQGGSTQQPMNLQLYNIRAKVKPCCFWDDKPGEFKKGVLGLEPVYTSEHITTTASGITKPSACTLAAAAPWQVAFTEENPTAYGCNGAKSECPHYTGPKFTELVDAKMDTGDRITAKQILELRFHSADWNAFASPRQEYEKRFENPNIWAWATATESLPNSTSLPTGRLDEFSSPVVQEVSIDNLTADTPSFTVGGPQTISTGTPTIGQAPKFPDLIKELNDASVGLEVIWPRKSSASEPFIRKTFTPEEMYQWISVQINSDREAVAINLTKHPQDGDTDAAFVTKIKQNHPKDAILDIETALPGLTFPVPLVLDGHWDTLNHIRIYLEKGATSGSILDADGSVLTTDGSMLTADVYVRHIFHHAEVAQTSFIDKYGHAQVDPWIDHFTDINIEAKFQHLTKNTDVHGVLWNTFASNGKKTVYAIEKVKEVTSGPGADVGDLTWEPLGCGAVAVTFTGPEVNRVYPWRAWGEDTKGTSLFVKVDRSGNNLLTEEEEKEVELKFLIASTKGTAMPANTAIFGIPTGKGTRPLDRDKDVLMAKYAYTEYKQGPIEPEDQNFLKFPSDVTKVINDLAYDVTYSQDKMSVDGTFLKVGSQRIRSCEEVIGDCYTDKALDNEGLATTVFFAGGLGESGVKTPGQMQTECREEFNAKYGGSSFPDGTTVTYSRVVDKLANIALSEGSQHYNVIFSDSDGRPVGTKKVGFVSQSSVAQARDVEIKYKWGAHMQHYPTRPQMVVYASSHEPTFATRERLIQVIYEYDPTCGDHAETSASSPGFHAFDLATDQRGALWYPYKQCLQPRYHVGFDEWWGPYNYTNTVEGFDNTKRRFYWERMRFFDQYRPSIMNLWGQIGCFFSEYTTTANAHRPVVFTGYTKVRSDHSFGAFATDRESVRISRHWEKRQLEATAETISQEEGGLSIELTDEFRSVLYDEDGNLKEGSNTTTPVWVHINDGFAVVKPASEELNHPFGRYLLNNVGSYGFSESFNEDRLPISEVFVDRDYTSSAQRATDGTKVYITEESFAHNSEGELEDDTGREIKWVFADKDKSWAWLAPPPDPERNDISSDETSELITGLHVSNVGPTFLKKSKKSATHPEEGSHTVTYTPHTFTVSGTIDTPATLSMDQGPEWNISQTDGLLYVLEGSPYLTEEHEGADYEFSLFGAGPGGLGILADNRGLQFFEADGEKRATYAGVNITLLYDINELPHTTVNIDRIPRLADDEETSVLKAITSFVAEYPASDRSIKSLELNFNGHYYVEEVIIDFKYGREVLSDVLITAPSVADIPVINISGLAKVDGVATISGTSTNPTLPDKVAFTNTTYTRGDGVEGLETKRLTFDIKQRLFTLDISLGARNVDKRTIVERVRVMMRDHRSRSETIYTYEPRVQVSSAHTGTHKPSDLEFYFQREVPDFAKNYQLGTVSLADLSPGQYSVTELPGVDVKWLGRRIKDIIPMFNFTNFEGIFPYDNIDIAAIDNYTESTSPAGQTLRYLDTPVLTSSKGWTLSTSRHYSDPSASLVPTDTGPGGQPNVFVDNWPNEDLQEYLYDHAGQQLGNISVYQSFWHPNEKEFFADAGIDLDSYSWELKLTSTVAPIDRVFRDHNYGCHLDRTTEDLDGQVHRLPTWQAKGVFHYLCDPRYSWACLAVVMNKCNEALFEAYGTAEYLDNNVVDRFSYKFEFPPRDTMAYQKEGLFNKNEIGGYIGGTGGISANAVSQPFPPLSQIQETYQGELYITGGNKYD